MESGGVNRGGCGKAPQVRLGHPCGLCGRSRVGG